MSTKKNKEVLDWISLDEAQSLHTRVPALVELVNSLPADSKLVRFLFPSDAMMRARKTTKDRLLGLCKALEGTNLKNVIKRLQRIEARTIKPADPAAFLRFLSALYKSNCRDTFLPYQLDLSPNITSFRPTKYLGHKNLPVKAWGSLSLFGHLIFHLLHDKHASKTLHDSLLDTSRVRGSQRSAILCKLLKLIEDANYSSFTEDPALVNALQQSLCSYPAVENTPFIIRAYLSHLFDFTPNHSLSAPKHGVNLGAHDPHQLFFFTDGAHVYLKVGVFTPPTMADATKFVAPERVVPPGKDLTFSTNGDTWYAMYNVLTGAPALFNFDKHFVPAGQVLPENGGPWFTVATFSTGRQNEMTYVNAKALRKVFPTKLVDHRHLLVDPEQHADLVLPCGGTLLYEEKFSDPRKKDVPQNISLHYLYCEQVPSISLYRILLSLTDTIYSHLTIHPDHLPENSYFHDHPDKTRDTTTNTSNRLHDHRTLEQHLFYTSVLHATPCRFNAPSSSHIDIPLFTAMYAGLPLIAQERSPFHGVYSPRLRFDQRAGAQSCISYSMATVASTTATDDNPATSFMSDETSDKEKPLLPFFTNDKEKLSKYFDAKQVDKLDNYGPLAMAGSSAMVSLCADADTFQRESYEALASETLSAHTFVITTPLAGPFNASAEIALNPLDNSYISSQISAASNPTVYQLPAKMDSASHTIFSPSIQATSFISPLSKPRPTPPPKLPFGLCLPAKRTTLPHAINTFRTFLSPLNISEGVIHVHPSLNALAFLHKWMPRLLALRQRMTDAEVDIIQRATKTVSVYADSTVSRKFAKDAAGAAPF